MTYLVCVPVALHFFLFFITLFSDILNYLPLPKINVRYIREANMPRVFILLARQASGLELTHGTHLDICQKM